jgi:sulfur-carrier protein
VIVRIPTPLRSYTAGAAKIDAQGTTVDELLIDLDNQFPGIRFRMVDEQNQLRTHMRIYVDAEMVRDLTTTVADTDEVTIVQALSGGV